MRRFRRLAVHLLVLIAALTLAGVAAPSAGHFSRVAPGVTVGGLPVGGFTSEETRILLRDALSQPVRFELGRRTWTASARQLGVEAAVDDTVAASLHARTGAEIVPEAAASRPDLRRYAEYLARTFDRKPHDARVVGVDARQRPAITREVVGRRLDVPATIAAIESAVARAARDAVRPVFRTVRPKVTRKGFGHVIVIRRGSNALSLYRGRKLVRTLGVATGAAEFPTPLGVFAIVDKQYHPWWYPPASDWAKGLKPIPPGPGNPLGTRWMGLNVYGVGIHGTPNAASIGYSASHGCIRMHIAEAEWLFGQVTLGTPVVIVSA